jgi:hypothetical protein
VVCLLSLAGRAWAVNAYYLGERYFVAKVTIAQWDKQKDRPEVSFDYAIMEPMMRCGSAGARTLKVRGLSPSLREQITRALDTTADEVQLLVFFKKRGRLASGFDPRDDSVGIVADGHLKIAAISTERALLLADGRTKDTSLKRLGFGFVQAAIDVELRRKIGKRPAKVRNWPEITRRHQRARGIRHRLLNEQRKDHSNIDWLGVSGDTPPPAGESVCETPLLMNWVKARATDFEACFRSASEMGASTNRWKVNAHGQALEVREMDTTFAQPQTSKCVLGVIGSGRFFIGAPCTANLKLRSFALPPDFPTLLELSRPGAMTICDGTQRPYCTLLRPEGL